MRMTAGIAGIAVTGLVAGHASAQIAIDWYTIDGGGGTSAGGSFVITGTIGQWDAGDAMNGGAFTVVGGFWAGATSTPACIWQIAGCPSDYDNSGGSDGDDIIAFFADWDAGEPCSDVDESGGTDSDDVILFFARWDAGGC